MKRIIIPLLVVAGLFSCKQQEEDLSGQVAEFYKALSEASLDNNVWARQVKPGIVLKKYLTPGLNEKLNSTGFDALFGGVPYDAQLPEKVENLGGGWYRTVWNDGLGGKAIANLKAEMVDESFKITYVSPDDRWGDEMIAPKDEEVPQVDDTSSAKEFVETFYDAYLYWYCQYPKDLESKLSDLRNKYLSEYARSHYEYVLTYTDGGISGYDLLISARDFEYISLETVEVEQLSDENQFLVTYRPNAPENDWLNFTYVEVEKNSDGRYVISGFVSSEFNMTF